jgi:putative FmdB family regulatory protein
MPIYEFFCNPCNTLFNFFSSSINTTRQPKCPKCKISTLERQMSTFSVTGKANENSDMDNLPVDEKKIEQAIQMLASESENINEDDPRQAASLMRKFSHLTGVDLGDGMDEAISRMERGEDPDAIESEMGDLLEGTDPFAVKPKKAPLKRTAAPIRDERLYDL